MKRFLGLATLVTLMAASAGAADVCFFDGQNYTGASFCAQNGAVINNLNNTGWNDRISSIAIYGPFQVLICDDANFKDTCATINQHMPSLSHLGLEGRISSIKVSYNTYPPAPPPSKNRACFYDGGNLDGEGFCLNQGQRMDDLGKTQFNDRISSMRVGRYLTVRACEHKNFGGRCSDFREGKYDLSQYLMNNIISSIQVY